MSGSLEVPWGRRVAQLARGEGEASVVDVARRLLRLAHPIEEPLARRLVATAIGVSWQRVPRRIGPESLPVLLHGPMAATPLDRAEFVVVDLETTGLSPRRSTILEIGAVRVERLRRIESFHTLCNPGDRIPPRITRLTGIDAHTIDGAPTLHEAMDRFRRWLSPLRGVPFVAHNATFDRGFVDRALARQALPPLEQPLLCTRRLACRLLPELGRFGLDSLCAHFGISNRSRHRALGDAEATARALIELIALGRTRAGMRTLGDLLELLDRPPERGRRRAARWQLPGGV